MSLQTWVDAGSGGQVLPRHSVLRWAISRAFLCGDCKFSPCSQVFPPQRTPTEKHAEEQNTLLSLTTPTEKHAEEPDQDGRFTWSGSSACFSVGVVSDRRVFCFC